MEKHQTCLVFEQDLSEEYNSHGSSKFRQGPVADLEEFMSSLCLVKMNFISFTEFLVTYKNVYLIWLCPTLSQFMLGGCGKFIMFILLLIV